MTCSVELLILLPLWVYIIGLIAKRIKNVCGGKVVCFVLKINQFKDRKNLQNTGLKPVFPSGNDGEFYQPGYKHASIETTSRQKIMDQLFAMLRSVFQLLF